jgi:hypothetical protein
VRRITSIPPSTLFLSGLAGDVPHVASRFLLGFPRGISFDLLGFQRGISFDLLGFQRSIPFALLGSLPRRLLS